MDRSPLISIIVVNWNGRAFLQECLDSLLAQTYPRREVVVVDNASTDGSVAWLKSQYGTRITVIENSHNDGFGTGMNIGFQAATGDFFAILNNDAVAAPRWLEELLTGMFVDPAVGMCACKVLFAHDPRLINSAGNFLYPDGVSARRGFQELDTGQYDRVEETLFPDGSAALYRKAMLDEIGGFDEQFFVYSEDTELGLRGWLMGWRCLYIPTAVVYHAHSGTMSRFSPKKALLVERNRLWVAVKLFPLPMLLLNPVFTLNRFFWNVYSVVSGRGSAGRFCAQYSKTSLVLILLKASVAGVRGLPAMIRKRRRLKANARMDDREFIRLVRRFRVTAKEIALRDR